MTDIFRIIRSLVNLVAIMINLYFLGSNSSTNNKNNLFNGFLIVYEILSDPEPVDDISRVGYKDLMILSSGQSHIL